MGKKRLWKLSAICAGMTVLQASAAFAAEDVGVEEMVWCDGIYQDDVGDIEYVELIRNTYLSNASALTVEDVIYNGLLAQAESIDIRSYGISTSDIANVFTNVLNKHADLFYVGRGIRYSSSGTIVSSVKPTYTMADTELEEAKDFFKDEMNSILELVEDDWSDLEKALFLHDYLATHFEYDMRVYDTTQRDEVVFDSYGFFVQGTGVCQAYTVTYNYLLEQVGINGSFATSTAMNHIWNMIEIDGQWYHVDVTWDDPTKDTLGKALHSNFLRSDEGITATKHHDWVSDYKATSTKFDNSFWQASKTSFVYEDDQWYYISGTGLATCDVNAQTVGSTVYEISDIWYGTGNSYWPGVYSGLGEYNGVIYFNGSSKIYSYDVATKSVKTAYTLSLASGTNIYGMTLDENKILYGTATTPNDKIVATGSYTLPLAPEEPKIDLEADVEFSYEVSETETAISCKGEDVTPKNLKLIFGSSAEVYKGDTKVADTEAVGTGYEVKVGKESYTVVVKGDIDGDAAIDAVDMEKIQKHILHMETLEGAYLEAGMLAEGSDELSALDMEEIQKYLLHLTEW